MRNFINRTPVALTISVISGAALWFVTAAPVFGH